MDQPTIPPSQQPPKHPLTIPPGMGDLNYLQSLLSAVNLQELFPASSPTFVGLTLSGLTASLPIVTNASKALASVTYATFKASLAIAQADVAGLTTASSPTFAGLTLTAFSGFVKATAGVLSAGAIAAGDLPAHVLDGAVHTVSGLTGGHFLKATGATTFGFAAHGLTYSDVGAEASGAVATHAALITGVHGLVFTAGKAMTLQKSMTFTAADDTGVYTYPTGTKTLMATDGSPAALVIASQATGDILYASSATAWARLAIGAAGKALVVNGAGTLPEWGTVLANPMTDPGDMIYGGVAGAPTRLAAGATTTILVGGGAAAPVWTTATGTGAPMRGTSPTITTSLIMSDGATIGQAAGPLVAFDDTNNYLEITGCSVGIGTTAPGYPLDVVGRIKSTYAGQYNAETGGSIILMDTDTEMNLGVDTANNVGFISTLETGTAWGTRALALQPNGGKVGIGTTTPTSPLQVVGLTTYAGNAAAVAGGLTAGAFYKAEITPGFTVVLVVV